MPDAAGHNQFTTNDFPVVRGAICRGILDQQPIVPHNLVWGIGEEQPFDPALHTELPSNSPLIFKPRYGSDPYVENRWFTLLGPGDLATHSDSHPHPHLQRYEISTKDLVALSQVYVSRIPIDTHDPIRVSGHNTPLRDGIEMWSGQTTLHLKKDQLHGYRRLHARGKKGSWDSLRSLGSFKSQKIGTWRDGRQTHLASDATNVRTSSVRRNHEGRRY